MYIPKDFAETRHAVLHDLIRAHGFATIVTNGPEGPVASHVPVILLPDRSRFGTLQFHLAKPNPHVELLAAGEPSMAIFHGPHAYISPRWYVSPVTVPTWNYAVVHAHGRAQAMDDAQTAEHLRRLTAAYEPSGDGAWNSERLPADVFAKLRAAIVGFEVEVTRIEGKWKLGQNRREEDVRGAVDGLLRLGDPQSAMVAQMMTAARDAKRKD
jgi:transcriptional regulator